MNLNEQGRKITLVLYKDIVILCLTMLEHKSYGTQRKLTCLVAHIIITQNMEKKEKSCNHRNGFKILNTLF